MNRGLQKHVQDQVTGKAGGTDERALRDGGKHTGRAGTVGSQKSRLVGDWREP